MPPFAMASILIRQAKQLKSDSQSPNPEYDRALVELCTYSMGYDESYLKTMCANLGMDYNTLYPN